MGIVSVVISAAVGTVIGLVAGFAEGAVDVYKRQMYPNMDFSVFEEPPSKNEIEIMKRYDATIRIGSWVKPEFEAVREEIERNGYAVDVLCENDPIQLLVKMCIRDRPRVYQFRIWPSAKGPRESERCIGRRCSPAPQNLYSRFRLHICGMHLCFGRLLYKCVRQRRPHTLLLKDFGKYGKPRRFPACGRILKWPALKNPARLHTS